ncbi:ribonuclease P protein component [Beggiatoa leptomitoformis]|uniref:Ribonuclease P protein component n=1 Tax=Beggiatoa leptomitoformis TaxID=288004 RepID=A0A2N9YCF1_9GAMM|nr:ribonuclease P protein component [Beggiatoa leptomitoformis]ALG66560.1 ribonuclease P protein component [Beggiatoa leptomitoformis]AUI68141.1 ribonuclease P protein component [Beggiatoa leptomitoformis]
MDEVLHYAFSRQQRLLKSADFKKVFEKSYKSGDRYLTVLARANGFPQARLGLAIAKKQIKLAVMRNRVKRLVRDSFRLHQHTLAGLDCVVLARQNLADIDNSTLLCSLTKHWRVLAAQCKKS